VLFVRHVRIGLHAREYGRTIAGELELSEHAARTREMWNADAPNWVELGRAAWASESPSWGIWQIPEERARILPDVRGLDVLDLGCGTGYWCAWFARMDARPAIERRIPPERPRLPALISIPVRVALLP
jgi:2-polyprenyl-3-methyl-5-hydroxy-6-metoxy-1,4-benzoquinol methylase